MRQGKEKYLSGGLTKPLKTSVCVCVCLQCVFLLPFYQVKITESEKLLFVWWWQGWRYLQHEMHRSVWSDKPKYRPVMWFLGIWWKLIHSLITPWWKLGFGEGSCNATKNLLRSAGENWQSPNVAAVVYKPWATETVQSSSHGSSLWCSPGNFVLMWNVNTSLSSHIAPFLAAVFKVAERRKRCWW